MRHKVLYIPGLGDHYYDAGRSFILRSWRVYGLEAELIPIKWYDKSAYGEKLALVKQKVTAAKEQGSTVTIIGESAGASLALNAAASSLGVSRIILIAGVNSSKLPISSYIQNRSPSFMESQRAISASIEKIHPEKIHTIRALFDPTVSPRFNDIPGAANHVLFTFGHVFTVLLCLTILSPFVVKIIKSK